MRFATGLRAVTATLLLGSASGCTLLPQIPFPAIPLDASEQRAVLACQRAISRQASALVRKAYKEFDGCAVQALDLELEREREIDSTNIAEYVARRQRAVERCDTGLRRVGVVSRRATDGILRACAPVEGLVLEQPERGDPLGWKTIVARAEDTLNREIEPTAEGLAGAVCATSVSQIRDLVLLSVGRSSDLIRKFYGFNRGEDFSAHLRSFLDPRCRIDTSL